MLTCFLVSRASVTCLLGVELVLRSYFAVVKGIGDVLAGLVELVLRCYFVVSSASMTCLLGYWSSSFSSRVSVTCLLDVEPGAEVVKCVGDVLAGVLELFVLVKGVGDVLA